MNSEYYINLTNKYGAHNYHPLGVVLKTGKGVWVTDIEEKRYLDMLSSYSALNFGHCNDRLIKVATEQLSKITLTSRAFYNDKLALFLEAICSLSNMDQALPMNSGAEAVETAIKAARKWGYEKKGVPPEKAEIITFHGNFHGRTTTIISFSSSETSKSGFGPFTPGFKSAKFGDIKSLSDSITANTVAVLIEPIQGEGGVIIPPAGYLKAVRELCNKNRVLMLADEIQTGLGRTGKLFACDHEGIKPDLYIIAKALGGGIIPISAIVGTTDVMEVFTPGTHGSTFGGNPMACAIALEVINILKEDEIIKNASNVGRYFVEKLTLLNLPKVVQIRARGLLIGVEIDKKFGPAYPICEQLAKLGILCKDTQAQTIRFTPPLTITTSDIDWALERISQVL